MKKLIPVLLVMFFVACKKEDISPTLTKEFSIHSQSTGADYSIQVALPENYDPSSNKYSTIYVLDGEDNFGFVASNSQEISRELSTQNVLVVGIGYGNDRKVDYTPTKADEGDGGAENFMRFIRDELIPRIENDFSADTLRSKRVILGHSFGGLLATYAFTNFNNAFGHYILLSPSLWYDNEIMFRLEQEHRHINDKNQQLVFMGIGESENSGRMHAPFEAFRQRLTNFYPGIKISSNIEPQLDHMGSKNPNIREGLNFYFQNR